MNVTPIHPADEQVHIDTLRRLAEMRGIDFDHAWEHGMGRDGWACPACDPGHFFPPLSVDHKDVVELDGRTWHKPCRTAMHHLGRTDDTPLRDFLHPGGSRCDVIGCPDCDTDDDLSDDGEEQGNVLAYLERECTKRGWDFDDVMENGFPGDPFPVR